MLFYFDIGWFCFEYLLKINKILIKKFIEGKEIYK